MARKPRSKLSPGYYHCLNRGVGKREIFFDEDDYRWFAKNLLTLSREHGIELMAYCLMPNHWHIALQCSEVGQMTSLFTRLLNRHTRRHHRKYQTIGHGPIYQGRYKSIHIESEAGVDNVCSYIEQNPLRAELVKDIKEWKWSSAYAWGQSRD